MSITFKNLGNLNVLVVEDDPDFAEALVDMLTQNGIHSSIARDGKIAQQMTNKHKYDVILTDITMPNCGGFELLSIVQNTNQTPIIVMSGQADSATEKMALQLGAKGVLSKPFKLNELLNALHNAVHTVTKKGA